MSEHFHLDAGSWDLLCHAPLAIWLAMSAVDTVVDSPRLEADAFDAALAKAKQRAEDDPLLLAVLDDAVPPSNPQRRAVAFVDPAHLLDQLERVHAVLERSCGADEAKRFGRSLLRFGYDVAAASCESLTGAGIGVSQAEERFLARARRALGLHEGA